MTLTEQLHAIKEKSKERIPAEARQIMERSIEDQRKSGALDRVVKVGQRAPEFTLPNAAGKSIEHSVSRKTRNRSGSSTCVIRATTSRSATACPSTCRKT